MPADIPSNELLAVHPTQAYETIIALVIWFVGLRMLVRGNAAAGVVTLVTLVLLSLERFGIEFLRAKDDRFFGLFTTAQIIAVSVMVIATILLVRRLRTTPEAG